MNGDVVDFADAEVGQSAYTWETDGGDWGDYRFETVDPLSVYSKSDLAEGGPLIRKRWVLAEVAHIGLEDDDEVDR